MDPDDIWLSALDSVRVGACLVTDDLSIGKRNDACRRLLPLIGLASDAGKLSGSSIQFPRPGSDHFPRGLAVDNGFFKLGVCRRTPLKGTRS